MHGYIEFDDYRFKAPVVDESYYAETKVFPYRLYKKLLTSLMWEETKRWGGGYLLGLLVILIACGIFCFFGFVLLRDKESPWLLTIFGVVIVFFTIGRLLSCISYFLYYLTKRSWYLTTKKGIDKTPDYQSYCKK